MRIPVPREGSYPGSESIQTTGSGPRRSVLYASGKDPLRGVFRSVGDPIAAGMNRSTTVGFPNAGLARENLLTAARLLGTVALPGPSTFRVGTDASDWGRVTSTLAGALSVGRHGLLDLGDAVAGAQQTFLTRHISLTDFCYPDAEIPGAVLFSVRHQLDLNALAVQFTPAGRDHRIMETSWFDLSEVAAVAVNRMDCGGVRPSLVTLSFLAACRSDEYPDRCAAETLRTHIISNSGSRRTCERLNRFAACLTAMVRCRVFPHKIMNPFGGLLSWTSQREIASVTAVARGPQEGVQTDMSNAPRSSVNVPACTYLDLDDEIKLSVKGCGASVLYAVFLYVQKPGREGFRPHIVRSRLPETAFKEGLEHLYGRLRVSNAVTGNEDAKVPTPNIDAHFPLLRLYRESKRPTGRSKRIAGATRPAGPLCGTVGDEGKYQWNPDLRNRPTPNSCMYAAYCRLGYMDELSTSQRRSERCGSVDVPTVFLTGVVWNAGMWKECY